MQGLWLWFFNIFSIIGRKYRVVDMYWMFVSEVTHGVTLAMVLEFLKIYVLRKNYFIELVYKKSDAGNPLYIF